MMTEEVGHLEVPVVECTINFVQNDEGRGSDTVHGEKESDGRNALFSACKRVDAAVAFARGNGLESNACLVWLLIRVE